MSADTRADVYNLPIGDVVFERPARLSSAEIEDIEDWLKLLLRKIKREAAAPPDPDEEE